MALPHVSVPSIAWLDWEALRKAGFEGCVFDKDNTLTEPYADEVAPQLLPSLRRCQQAFGGRLVLFSNSAGLAQFDPRGAPALLKMQWEHLESGQFSHGFEEEIASYSLCYTLADKRTKV